MNPYNMHFLNKDEQNQVNAMDHNEVTFHMLLKAIVMNLCYYFLNKQFNQYKSITFIHILAISFSVITIGFIIYNCIYQRRFKQKLYIKLSYVYIVISLVLTVSLFIW